MNILTTPRLLLTCFLILIASLSVAQADTLPRSAIATAHPLATQAGHEILDAGGNAFDAAVAITAALAVVEPASSGLGGGGFWLLHRTSDAHETMLDGREKAPLEAHRDMYLDAQGDVIPGLSVDGALAAAIPGTPAALEHLARKYGRLPLAQSLAPAIKLARAGFVIDKIYRQLAGFRLAALRASPAAAQVFLDQNEVPAEGAKIIQTDLATTLQAIAAQGAQAFYKGPLAARMVEGVRVAGGVWNLADLAQFTVKERAPVRGDYRGMKITSAAPPSSGGVALLTMLNILEGYALQGLSEAQRTHLVVEAMRRAYRDRADYLGDPDFVSINVARLTDKDYAAGLRAGIRRDQATLSASLPGTVALSSGTHTTHFSVLDKDGNRVAATMSINFPFGSGHMVAGTGVLLNDEMDDFSAKPGTPNVYGLIGAEANAIAPGKRPLSSMTPTFLEHADGTVAILGTPGGSRIITMVLLAALDFAAGHDPDSWVKLKRFHHQFLPDVVQFEPGALSTETLAELEKLGHELMALEDSFGNMQAVMWASERGATAASDPRGIGVAEVW